MPITYVIDKVRGQLRTTVSGQVTVEDILGHLEAVRRDDALPYAELIDAEGAARSFDSTAEVWNAATRVLAQEIPQPFGPRAVIVRNELAFALTRVFSSVVGGNISIEPFRDREAAEQWLAEHSRAPGGG